MKKKIMLTSLLINIRFSLPFLLFSFSLFPIYAQNFQGTVTDAETSYPLSYTNVYVPSTQQGMYSNDEGIFNVNLTGATDADSIWFSHIGYNNLRTTIGALKTGGGNVSMRSSQYNLEEVIITPYAAKELIQLAVSKVKDNYPAEYSRIRMIFKDFSRRGGHRSHYNYFDYETYIQSYQGKKAVFSTKVYKYEMYDKKGEFAPSMKPTDLMRIVMLEQSFSDERLKNYEFRYLSSDVYAGEEFDVIGFKGIPNKKNDFLDQSGRVFIGKKDREIRYVEINVRNIGSKRFFLVAKMDSLNVQIKVAFKPFDGKYVLDYAQQSTYAKGKIFGKSDNLVYSTTSKSTDHQLKVPQASVATKDEVEEIYKKEKPKSIDLLKTDPDMR